MPYTSPENHHRHECNDCGALFEHRDPAGPLSPKERIRKHRCPNCGATAFGAYHGEFAPDYSQTPEDRCTGSKTLTATLSTSP